MKKKRLVKRVAKRRKKEEYKAKLNAIRDETKDNIQEYRIQKDTLQKKYGIGIYKGFMR